MSHSVIIPDNPDHYTVDGVGPLEWALANCASYITNSGFMDKDQINYVYYFSEEKDAAIFALRWS